ncbi:MAG TPA: polysaccharide biosynthesis/export family protein, partial [Alloacidobacterium sp.]|nr:polysaccharide biosynthesis/export family protein [Alloacidobacterium sp.]
MPNGKKILFGAFALLLLLAGRAFGQQKESLLIGPGDMLHITVFDSPEFEQHVRVSDAGDIVLVLGGKVHVAGQTPAEAAHSVESALKSGGIMNYPRVAVLVEEYATQSVYITGEVKAPGARAIRTPLSVIDVLTMAGGLTGAADRKILIQRRGTKELVPYFVSNDANVAFQSAVTVYPGDTVIVPKAGIVYMLGDVKTPGGYTMTNNEGKISVLELVARAGGTNHSAV